MVSTNRLMAARTGNTWDCVNRERISAIAIHPQNPDIVYVGALGHAFGPNDERGVYMTTDGGKTWTRTLYIDREHGVSDLEMDSSNPNVLYAGMWSFERKPWTHRSGSEKGGVFKSIDGGRTWNKLTNGLPKLIGRVGVRAAPSNPNVVYAILEAKEGTLYRSDDRGETFKQVSKNERIVSRGFYYTRVRIDPTNENHVYAIASTLFESIDGGKTLSRSRDALTSTITRSGRIQKIPNASGRETMAAWRLRMTAGKHGSRFTTCRLASFIKFTPTTVCRFIA